MTEKDINALMTFPNIVHNKKKLEAIVSQAKGYLQIEKEYGSFSKFYGHMLMDILLICIIKLLQNVTVDERAKQLSKRFKSLWF